MPGRVGGSSGPRAQRATGGDELEQLGAASTRGERRLRLDQAFVAVRVLRVMRKQLRGGLREGSVSRYYHHQDCGGGRAFVKASAMSATPCSGYSRGSGGCRRIRTIGLLDTL
jgi:hypothetical protein